MDETNSGKKYFQIQYEEGHKRETRKSYQKYIEEINDHHGGSEDLSAPEGDEDSGDTEASLQVRKSRRTPVPKRSFGLIDNYSDANDGKKRDKPERNALPSQGTTPSTIKKPAGFVAKTKTDQKLGSGKVQKTAPFHVLDDSDTDNTPSRRSGRTPKPKKSFSLIENKFEYSNGAKKQSESNDSYDKSSEVPPGGENRGTKEKGNKRSRKSQPTKSVSRSEFFSNDKGVPQDNQDPLGFDVKQEIDYSTSPEYPIQSWKEPSSPVVKVEISNVNKEAVEEKLETTRQFSPQTIHDQNTQEWSRPTSNAENVMERIVTKREENIGHCMYCQGKQFTYGCHNEGCPGYEGNAGYRWTKTPDAGYGHLKEVPLVKEERVLGHQTPLDSEKEGQLNEKSKKSPGIMASMKKKKKKKSSDTSVKEEIKTPVVENLNLNPPKKKAKLDIPLIKSPKQLKNEEKQSKLTLTLKTSDEGISDSTFHFSPKEKKKAKKSKKDSIKSPQESTTGSTKGEKNKLKRKEEHASFTSITERSDGHIILKLSSPTGDDSTKETKKEKVKSSKLKNKEMNDKERMDSQDKEKKKKHSKPPGISNKGNQQDHIVLKLPVPPIIKEKVEHKKTVKRKKDSIENINSPDIRVKKKKVFKKKNGQRMLVKIVTEHLNKEGKVVKQEEQSVKENKLPALPKPEVIEPKRKEPNPERELLEKRIDIKKTPQKEKREPGKTKSNKEKKTQTLTAYILFCRKHRPKLVEENPDMDFSQISKKMAEKWKNTPEEEKEIYRQQLQEHKAKINAQKKTKLKYTGEKVIWEPAGKKEFPVVKYGTAYLQPVDMAAHLHLLGDALLMIATALRRQDQTTVHGALSVLLDSALCSIAPLVFLTSNVPELDVIPAETKASVLDDIAYILPGM